MLVAGGTGEKKRERDAQRRRQGRAGVRRSGATTRRYTRAARRPGPPAPGVDLPQGSAAGGRKGRLLRARLHLAALALQASHALLPPLGTHLQWWGGRKGEDGVRRRSGKSGRAQTNTQPTTSNNNGQQQATAAALARGSAGGLARGSAAQPPCVRRGSLRRSPSSVADDTGKRPVVCAPRGSISKC